MVVAIGTRKNRQTLIGRDYWIRVRSFCRHPCHRQSVSALFIQALCNQLPGALTDCLWQG
jgi:hypothetical protein